MQLPENVKNLKKSLPVYNPAKLEAIKLAVQLICAGKLPSADWEEGADKILDYISNPKKK